MKTLQYIFIMSLLLLSGCKDDFFELEQSPNPLATSVDDMERAVSSAYYAMTGNQGNESNFDVLTLVGSTISDEAKFFPEAGNNPQVSEFYSRSNAADNSITNSAFIASYKVIAQCNQFLPILEKEELKGLPNADQLPRQQGELYFLRAHSYYILSKLFAPANSDGQNASGNFFPLRLKPTTDIAEANSPAAPLASVYESIINDLKQAKSLLPADTAQQFKSYAEGRANRFGAAALLARVYFQLGRYDEALAECDFVIDQNGGLYNLTEQPIEAWNKSWMGGSKEVIWYYAVGNTPTRNGLGGSNTNWKLPRRFSFFNFSILSNNASEPGSPPGGNMRTLDRTLGISDSFLNQAEWMNPDRTPSAKALNDLRFTQLVKYIPGTDPVFSSLPPNQYWVNKFWRGPQSDWRAGAIPLLRLAELYATRAIIRFNKGDLQGAADDINTIRRRAWNEAAAGSPYVDLAAGDMTANLIHTERMIEMMYEGDRTYYLQGLRIDIPNGDRGEGSVPYSDASLFWPLPIRERELNQGLDN